MISASRRLLNMSNIKVAYYGNVGVTPDIALTKIRATRSFEHISDNVILLWLLERAEMRACVNGRARHLNAEIRNVPCSKAKKGKCRNNCDKCYGTGRFVYFLPDRVIGVVRKRRIVRYRGSLESIWNYISIKVDEAIIRLALTFGCVCPMTGEYVSKNDIKSRDRLYRYVKPRGFEGVVVHWTGIREMTWYFTPLSLAVRREIYSAIRRLIKLGFSEPSEDLVLSEFVKGYMLKSSTRRSA